MCFRGIKQTRFHKVVTVLFRVSENATNQILHCLKLFPHFLLLSASTCTLLFIHLKMCKTSGWRIDMKNNENEKNWIQWIRPCPGDHLRIVFASTFNIIEFKVQCYEHENLGNFPNINFGTFSNGKYWQKHLNNPRSICVSIDGKFAA